MKATKLTALFSLGSGLWSPEAGALALLREDVDHSSSRLKTVLKEPAMQREIFNGIFDNEEKIVKAFVEQNKESALKTKPKVSAFFFFGSLWFGIFPPTETSATAMVAFSFVVSATTTLTSPCQVNYHPKIDTSAWGYRPFW